MEIAKAKADIKLYNEFLNGDNESFNEIMRIYRKELIYFIMKFVHNFDIAEDLAQDTFLYMIINKKEYDFKYEFKTYIYTIARCRAINYLKKQKKIVNFDEAYMQEEDYLEIEGNIINEEKQKEILELIKKLKYEYQVAIYLRDFQEFQYKEISKILNKTVPQVKMLIHRARKSLKKKMEVNGYDE